MIREIRSPDDRAALTSDCWHVVYARWSTFATPKPRFERSIVSEHPDRDSAVAAAKALFLSSRDEMLAREPRLRDQVFVRRPGFNTLKVAGRVVRHRS